MVAVKCDLDGHRLGGGIDPVAASPKVKWDRRSKES